MLKKKNTNTMKHVEELMKLKKYFTVRKLADWYCVVVAISHIFLLKNV